MSKLGLYSVTLSEYNSLVAYNSHCLQLLTINASKSKRVFCGAAVQQYIEWISRYAGFSHIAMSLCVCLTRKRSRNIQSAHILGLAPCRCWQRVLFNASVRWRTCALAQGDQLLGDPKSGHNKKIQIAFITCLEILNLRNMPESTIHV